MKPYHLTAPLTIVAAILVDLAVGWRSDSASDGPRLVFLGLAFGQVALVAVWCGAARGNWTLRLGAVAITGAVLAKPLSWSTAAPWSEWLALIYLFATMVGTLVAVAGWRPGTGHVIRLVRARQSVNARPTSIGFSLQWLFALMVTVAVILAVARQITIPWHALGAFAGYSACLALAAFATVRAAGSTHPPTARAVFVAIICLAGGWLLSCVERAASPWQFTIAMIVHATTIWLGTVATTQSRKSLSASRSGT